MRGVRLRARVGGEVCGGGIRIRVLRRWRGVVRVTDTHTDTSCGMGWRGQGQALVFGEALSRNTEKIGNIGKHMYYGYIGHCQLQYFSKYLKLKKRVNMSYNY